MVKFKMTAVSSHRHYKWLFDHTDITNSCLITQILQMVGFMTQILQMADHTDITNGWFHDTDITNGWFHHKDITNGWL